MTNFLTFKRGKEILEYPLPAAPFEGNAFLPQTAFIPISLTKKNKLTPLVMRGEFVREGQLIARGTGKTDVNAYSSIPGVVYDFIDFDLPNGELIQSIAIKLEGSFDILGKTAAHYSWRESAASELLRTIDFAGIINTAFSNNESLACQLRTTLKTDSSAGKSLCINFFDKDPSCGLDSVLFDTFYNETAEGIGIIAKIIEAEHIICMHHCGKNEQAKLEKIAAVCSNCEVEFIKSSYNYPSVENFRLPKNTEVFWLDVPTAIYTYEAVKTNNPVTASYVLISGKAVNECKVLKVRIGTPIGSLIEECGGFKVNPEHIILNGLMSGYSINNLDIPVTKNLKSIHVPSKDTIKSYARSECINCGLCFNSCPLYLEPKKIVKAIEDNCLDSKIIKQINMCKGCSCCSATCPARVPLSSIIGAARENLKQRGNV